MNKRFLNAIFAIVFLIISFPALSNIRLPSVVSSNMVLQQQSVVRLWGWADPGEGVYITNSWSGKTDSVWATRGATWELLIKTPAAGGPYTITLKGKNEIVLDNILIGEVWVCSGQSNMEMNSVSGVDGMNADLPLSANSQIRFFHIPKTTSQYPQDNCGGTWQLCDSVSLKTFSAVGYYFGKKLHDSLHVPIGLINASWAGTNAETWAPASLTENDAVMKNAAAKIKQTNWWPTTPGLAYNGMIAPITNFTIAGVIWYQGEGNAAVYATYQQVFTGLISEWRRAWKKDFPFYYVQIAPYTYGNENISAFLREQQTRAMSLPNTGMVVITDLTGDVKNIHPRNKKDVGLRLANWALAETYHHSGLVYKSPMYRNMIVEKGKAEIYFDNAPNGFIIKGNKATEWFIAGEDRLFLPAEVTIMKDRIQVFNKNIKNPVAVRFAFSDTAIGNIFSKEGLPVGPFRTDNW
jgi:sialate O-acetylesterase